MAFGIIQGSSSYGSILGRVGGMRVGVLAENVLAIYAWWESGRVVCRAALRQTLHFGVEVGFKKEGKGVALLSIPKNPARLPLHRPVLGKRPGDEEDILWGVCHLEVRKFLHLLPMLWLSFLPLGVCSFWDEWEKSCRIRHTKHMSSSPCYTSLTLSVLSNARTVEASSSSK